MAYRDAFDQAGELKVVGKESKGKLDIAADSYAGVSIDGAVAWGESSGVNIDSSIGESTGAVAAVITWYRVFLW